MHINLLTMKSEEIILNDKQQAWPYMKNGKYCSIFIIVGKRCD